MPTKLHLILTALETALAATGLPVKRNEALPETVGTAGLIILRDGEPGEPFVTMSPLTYEYDHTAEIEVYVQRLSGREAMIDAVRAQIGAIITADRTLGGLCEWVEPVAPDVAAFTVEGAAPMLTLRIPVTLSYLTTDPLA